MSTAPDPRTAPADARDTDRISTDRLDAARRDAAPRDTPDRDVTARDTELNDTDRREQDFGRDSDPDPDPTERHGPIGAGPEVSGEPAVLGRRELGRELGRRELVRAQKERYGGIKWGAAFFGWLTATGAAVLLIGIAAAAGAAVGLTDPAAGAGGVVGQAGRAVQDPATAGTVGVTGAVVVLVVLFLAYLCGGYVAGRMARFQGLRQGLAVWVWAVLIAVLVTVVGALAGSRWNVPAALGGLPRIPLDAGALTAGAVVAALLALAASLVGALLGGLAGMRFHRSVDRAGFAD